MVLILLAMLWNQQALQAIADGNHTAAFILLDRAADAGVQSARYNLRALCHVSSSPNREICSKHGISTADFFQRPGARVLWMEAE